MEIKVGEYVRTYNGNIFKIISGNSDDYDIDIEYHKLEDTEEDWLESNRDNENGYFFDERHIKKHSPNIIDLIEVGDYVNGYLINYIPNNEKAIYHDASDCEDVKKFENKDIETIVTKEQFEEMEYKV